MTQLTEENDVDFVCHVVVPGKASNLSSWKAETDASVG